VQIRQREIEEKLGLGRVNAEELVFLLDQHFKSAEFVSDHQIDYPDSAHVAISLKYGGTTLSAIVPGIGLTEAVLEVIAEQVETKLLASPVPKVTHLTLFAHVPTEGYWRYKDRLVIRRAPDEAPRPLALVGQHPLILEVSYEGAEDGFTNNIRRERESHQWALLLTLLIPGVQLPRRVEFNRVWVVPFTEFHPSAPRVSIEAQEVYLFPRRSTDESTLSSRGNLPEIKLVEVLRTTVEPGQSLEVPGTLAYCLDVFSALSEDERQKVLRAAFWLNHAADLYRLSKSASYQSLIQAVEVLIDVPRGQPKCNECGRSRGIGSTALFERFLDEYSPVSSGLEPARRQLYGVRSSLSHGNSLLHLDEGILNNWYGPKSPFEHTLSRQASIICRQGIVNWLMDQGGGSGR
jgi:hypothetical protein